MKKYILTIDQGTTSTRAIIFDKSGNSLAMAQREVLGLYPQPGWVEEDALSIWVSAIDVINEVLVKVNLKIKDMESIGITNQRETTVVWDKKTGLPVYNAIVWQSRQTNDICEALEDKKEIIHQKTGLLINPYFSASKIRFILDHIKNGQKRAEKGELMFGNIDSWLLYKLTNQEVHATDVTNASRTLLYNIFEKKWDDDLLALFNIPKCMLPKVRPSSFDYGKALFFKSSVPITGIAGDQQAALFGHTCFKQGEGKNTYGTGCFMLLNIGEKPVLSKNGLLTTIAWEVNSKTYYALEGSVFVAGAAVQWLRDGMRMIKVYGDSEKYANACEDTNKVYVVPAFTGLGTPYWDSEARGAVFGLTRGSTKEHFIRATLNSIAYQTRDVFEVMNKETGIKVKTLQVDGGPTVNGYLMQFQSDMLGVEIDLPTCRETTALGAAYLAGLQTGFFKNLDEIKNIHSYQKVYKPHMKKSEANLLYKGWKLAVKATRTYKG